MFEWRLREAAQSRRISTTVTDSQITTFRESTLDAAGCHHGDRLHPGSPKGGRGVCTRVLWLAPSLPPFNNALAVVLFRPLSCCSAACFGFVVIIFSQKLNFSLCWSHTPCAEKKQNREVLSGE